jgi:hypothetical protein
VQRPARIGDLCRAREPCSAHSHLLSTPARFSAVPTTGDRVSRTGQALEGTGRLPACRRRGRNVHHEFREHLHVPFVQTKNGHTNPSPVRDLCSSRVPPMVGIRSPIRPGGWVLHQPPWSFGIPKREEPGKQAHPVLKYRVPQGSQVINTHLCNRSCVMNVSVTGHLSRY